MVFFGVTFDEYELVLVVLFEPLFDQLEYEFEAIVSVHFAVFAKRFCFLQPKLPDQIETPFTEMLFKYHSEISTELP